MAIQGQIAPLSGSMNQDVDKKYLPTDKGIVYHRLNLRPNSVDGNVFANEKIHGTRYISVQVPAGTNKTIGCIKDVHNDALVYFLHNSSGNHCIYRYYTKTKVIQKIFYSLSDLDLEDTWLNGFVTEGDIYWTNGTKEPKMFNLDKAANYTNGTSGDAYTSSDLPFSDNIFPFIKRPPSYVPQASYGTSNGVVVNSLITYEVNFNSLRSKQWQFKYNYVYKNNQESAYSPASNVPVLTGEIKSSGEWNEDLLINNVINVLVNMGGPDVKAVNLAVRDCSQYNSGSYYIFRTVDKYDEDGTQVISDNITTSYPFYNNTDLQSIDTDIGNRAYDNVPLSAIDLILIDGKYGAFARPELGYDLVETDFEVEIRSEGTNIGTSSTIPMYKSERRRSVRVTNSCNKTYYYRIVADVTIPSTFYPNSIYQISVPYDNDTKIATATYNSPASKPANYPKNVRDNLFSQLVAVLNGCDYPDINVYDGNGHDIARGDDVVQIGYFGRVDDTNVVGSVITVSSFDSYRTLKHSQSHQFGIVYNDGFGRYNVVHGTADVMAPELDLTAPTLIIKPHVIINHRPPIWAKTYRIVYNRFSSYTYFLYVPSVEQIVSDEANGVPSGKAFLKVNQALERIRLTYPNLQLSDYQWENGDRIRRTGETTSYQVLNAYVREWTEEVDGDDVDYNETGFLIEEPLTTYTYGEFEYVDCIEIYRPNLTQQDTTFYDIAQEFEILDPGTADRRHAGDFNNQSKESDAFDIPAQSTLDFGDVYYRQRLSAITTEPIEYVEDINASDYYQSSGIDVGRVAAKIDNFENKVINRVVRTENYIENSYTNRLNVMLSGTPYFDVSDVYGNIVGIEEVGDLMKVIQAHKETSVYIGKVTAKEADGTDITLLSDSVFGAFNRYVPFRGTTYRRSMTVNNRYLYYFDETTGEFIRSASNGQIAISSSYGMKSWFEDKAKELRESTESKDVIVGINNQYDEVYITFIIGSTTETLVFFEDDLEENKGFKYFLQLQNGERIPEHFSFYGDNMYSWTKGFMYEHDTGDTLNNFYGAQKSCSVTFFVNGAGGVQKRLSNIEIGSNKNIWDVEVTVEPGLNYDNQKTILKPGIIRESGNRLVSTFLRNILDRTGTENLQLLHTGHEMIGDEFSVTLSNDDAQEVLLKDVLVKFTISK